MRNNHLGYQFTYFSLRNPKKSRCGDASFAGATKINGEDCLLLIVADGVSRAPKDWLASKSTVALIKESLIDSNLSLPEGLSKSIEYANDKIKNGVEGTVGMLSTLSVLIYQPSAGKLYFANVGDSRIYGLTKNEWQQLTEDDAITQPYTENGRVKLQNGVPIMLSALTKAIGANPILEVEVKEMNIEDFEAFALCSDGFYSLPAFSDLTKKIYSAPDMEQEIKRQHEILLAEINDDASLALLRFPASEKIDLKEILSGKDESTPAYAILQHIESDLEKAIAEGANDYIGQLLSYMDGRNLFFERHKMIALLEKMIKANSQHNQLITRMVRRS